MPAQELCDYEMTDGYQPTPTPTTTTTKYPRIEATAEDVPLDEDLEDLSEQFSGTNINREDEIIDLDEHDPQFADLLRDCQSGGDELEDVGQNLAQDQFFQGFYDRHAFLMAWVASRKQQQQNKKKRRVRLGKNQCSVCKRPCFGKNCRAHRYHKCDPRINFRASAPSYTFLSAPKPTSSPSSPSPTPSYLRPTESSSAKQRKESERK